MEDGGRGGCKVTVDCAAHGSRRVYSELGFGKADESALQRRTGAAGHDREPAGEVDLGYGQVRDRARIDDR
jgi:hypothetical protein